MIVYLYRLLDMSVSGSGVLVVEDSKVEIHGDLLLKKGANCASTMSLSRVHAIA